MQTSDIIALPLGVGSALRRRRVFHPAGVIASGVLERLAPPGEGLPVESSEVLGRVSKGIGLPGGLPDVIGLAVRIPPAPFAATPWDILMASAGSGVVTRFALRPVRSWRAPMTTLMPLRHEGKYWWLRAQMTSGLDDEGLSLDHVSDAIDADGIEFALDYACGAADFTPLAKIRLFTATEGEVSDDVAFDPTIHSAPGVKLTPAWLTGIRQRAYERSREGRGSD